LHGFLYAAVNGVNSNTFDDRSVEPGTGSSMKNSKITEGSGIVSTNERITLYHGSKSGIHGAIMPASRRYCDFGKGFYMGTD
jgi:hypothetical protein